MNKKDEEYVNTCGLQVLHEMGIELITEDGKSINKIFEDNGVKKGSAYDDGDD